MTTIARDYRLSNAEEEVLLLAMDGKSTAAIAQDLGISGDAVRKRLSEVYQKFHITGRGPVKLTRLQQLLMTQYQG
ncbi:MAG: helix-turn-helix transcriptional regulator, partial [Cyanobacteria bacterium J06627_8]